MHVRVRDYVRVRVHLMIQKTLSQVAYLIVTWLSDTKVSKYSFGFAHFLRHRCFFVF